jgi:Septum formation
MRRIGLAAALAVVLAAPLGGCRAPGGVDGDLTDDWPGISAPTGFTPDAEVCHAGAYSKVGFREAYEVVDCDEPHRTETFAVGTFTATPAAADVPPATGSDAAKAAYAGCDTRAVAFVGADWRTARLWLGVVQPSPAAWRGGARWYRCDLIEVSTVEDDGDLVTRTGTLRGALTDRSSPLRLTCYAVRLTATGSIDTMPARSCTVTHNAEFVGVWRTGELPYPTSGEQWAAFHKGCRGLIATYAGVPKDKNLEFRTGVVSLPGGRDVWADGDRGVRCYLWVTGAEMTTSVKGGGAEALPIQYE